VAVGSPLSIQRVRQPGIEDQGAENTLVREDREHTDHSATCRTTPGSCASRRASRPWSPYFGPALEICLLPLIANPSALHQLRGSRSSARGKPGRPSVRLSTDRRSRASAHADRRARSDRVCGWPRGARVATSLLAGPRVDRGRTAHVLDVSVISDPSSPHRRGGLDAQPLGLVGPPR